MVPAQSMPTYKSRIMLTMATKISAAMRMMTCFFFCQQARDTGRKGKKKKRGGRRTDPLELLAVAVAQLLLEHGEQVGDDVEALRQQADALVHLEVAADGLVDGLELGLDPEELGRVEHGAVEVDADAQDEELSDLHVDVRPR